MKDYQRKYRAEHHEMVLEKKRQYRLDNPEKVRAQERVARGNEQAGPPGTS